MDYKKYMCVVFMSILCNWLCAEDRGFRPLFSLNNPENLAIVLNINTDKTISISPFKEGDIFYGFSVNGYIVQKNKDSFVRIILEDEEGTEYLVAESCRMLNNVDTVWLNNYCEETVLLNSIHPKNLIIAVKNATVELNSYNVAKNGSARVLSNSSVQNNRHSQIEEIVDNINSYNTTHKKLWLAGVTDLSLKPYAEKKRILGIEDNSSTTYGMEYYIDGVFEVGEMSSTQSTTSSTTTPTLSSLYVPEFDWRDRHGKNWMTSVKNQGASGFCYAFSPVSALEGMVNLYYNQKLDMDLSEEDAAVYCLYMNGDWDTPPTIDQDGRIRAAYRRGWFPYDVFTYMTYYGVCDEASLPFIDSPTPGCPATRPETNECIKINGWKYVHNFTDADEIKKYLIKHGPLSSGFHSSPSHAVTITGYKVLKEGDIMYVVQRPQNKGEVVIEKGDPRIGKTYWICKNSYGPDNGTKKDGYMYILFNDYKYMSQPIYIETPISSKNYSDADIACTDNDGDGYYYWGIGKKPASCLSWVPDTPDGDDSDYTKGPMNEYGFCMTINPDYNTPIYINQDTIWSTPNYLHAHVIVKSGATLTVSDKIRFYNGAQITLNKNSKLVVSNGTLENVSIYAIPGSKIVVSENGTIHFHKQNNTTAPENYKFFIPLGTELNLEHGEIE